MHRKQRALKTKILFTFWAFNLEYRFIFYFNYSIFAVRIWTKFLVSSLSNFSILLKFQILFKIFFIYVWLNFLNFYFFITFFFRAFQILCFACYCNLITKIPFNALLTKLMTTIQSLNLFSNFVFKAYFAFN